MGGVSPRTAGFRFGPFELDPKTGEVHKAGKVIRLRPQPAKVLSLLLHRAGEMVTRKEIQRQIWGDKTNVDFEKGVNLCIKQIRAALGDDARKPHYIETLPRRGYRFIAEMEKLSRPLRKGARVDGKISLAVLAFENLSGNPAQDYFADGITEALIAKLAQISALRVISRTSAMQYKGVRKPLPQIARELNADVVVEGSVMRSREQVRITALLIEAATDRHLWGASYERPLQDVLSLQSEVARTIANEIKVKLTPQEQARLDNVPSVKPQAHEAYLKGRHHWNKWTEAGFWKGIEYFHQAIAEDASYALGHAGLANSYAVLGGFGVLPPKECCPKAKAAAAKALEIDDTLAEAHTALAWVRMTYDWNWSGAEKEFKLAIELNPSFSTARFWFSLYLAVMGRRDEAIAEMKRARQLDPLSPNINADLAWLYLWERHYDQAIEQLQDTLELDPNFSMAHFWLGNVYLKKASFKEAIAEFRKALSLSGAGPAMLAGLGCAYAVAGMNDEARGVLKKLSELSKRRYVAAYDMASVHAGLGETDQMFNWLEKAYLERDTWLSLLKLDPRFETHRADPRIQALLRRIGLPP